MTCVNCRITMEIEPLRDEDGRPFCNSCCKDEYTERHAPDVTAFYEAQVAEMLYAHKPMRRASTQLAERIYLR